MTIAVTGATGFLGKYLVRELEMRNYDVVVIARPQENANMLFSRNIKIFVSNYSEHSLNEALHSVDVVIHLAAQTMQRNTHPLKVSSFYNANVNLTENLLLAATTNKVAKVIQMSSNSVYSSANSLPYQEDDHPIPSTIYGVSKLYAEKLGEYIGSKTGLNVISLRLARLFGFGERESVVFTKFMKLAIAKQPLQIWGKGETKVEYLYVRDAVSAILTAIENNIANGNYNVGVNKNYSVIEIAEAINNFAGNKGNVQFHSEKEENVSQILMESSKFMNETAWKAHWSLEQAIQEMHQLYKTND